MNLYSMNAKEGNNTERCPLKFLVYNSGNTSVFNLIVIECQSTKSRVLMGEVSVVVEVVEEKRAGVK